MDNAAEPGLSTERLENSRGDSGENDVWSKTANDLECVRINEVPFVRISAVLRHSLR